MERTPISIIIDDPAPLIHVYREHAGGNKCNALGEPLKDRVPTDFLEEFCDTVEHFGICGKFTIVPMPGCLGDIVNGIKGCDRSEVERWLRIANDRLSPYFDFCPEMLTHHYAVDLENGGFLEENEELWSRHQTRATLTPYITRALELLKAAGIRPTGVSSPWGFGARVEKDYSAAIADAFKAVFDLDKSWYFCRFKTGVPNTRPTVSHRENGLQTVAIACTCNDVFWQSIDSERTDPDYLNAIADQLISADGLRGQIIDCLENGSYPVILTHWQSMFSNGRRTGLAALREVGRRVDTLLGDRVRWTKFSTLMDMAIAEDNYHPL